MLFWLWAVSKMCSPSLIRQRQIAGSSITHTSLSVMSALADQGKLELGQKLFGIFTDEFRGIDSNNGDQVRSHVVAIAGCLGIYSKRQVRPLLWLSQFEFAPGILDRTDAYAPGYAPHLSAYIDALVQFRCTEKWVRLKRIKRLFPQPLSALPVDSCARTPRPSR